VKRGTLWCENDSDALARWQRPVTILAKNGAARELRLHISMKYRELPFAACFAVLASGCTVLGPMPATSGLNPVPNPRPGIEVGLAAVPGYYLSDTVQDPEDTDSRPSAQVSGMIEPGELIDLPGLSIGARWSGGGDGAGYAEPMLRYRRYLDAQERFALAGVAFGTYAKESYMEQEYSALRVGGEAMADLRLTPKSQWLEVHLGVSASATALDAEGRYCLDPDRRWGTDCDRSTNPPVSVSVGGVYPSGTGALALHSGRHLLGVFHGLRLALMGSVGSQPEVEYAKLGDARAYASAGLSLTLGLGAGE
jgi:hypothetical protein